MTSPEDLAALEEVLGPTGNGAYVKKILDTEFVPLARECKELASLDVEGVVTIGLQFAIAGSAATGGFVESARISGEGDIPGASVLRECLIESALSLAFAPPPDGARVYVDLPLILAPGTRDSQTANLDI